MTILNIRTYPDPPLKQKAERVVSFGPELAKFAEDMVETMFAGDGVGLAAPQVGVSRQILVLCEPRAPCRMVNPEILDEESLWRGGCLSFRVCRRIPRTRIGCAPRIAMGTRGGGSPRLPARIIQHEYDHLQETLSGTA